MSSAWEMGYHAGAHDGANGGVWKRKHAEGHFLQRGYRAARGGSRRGGRGGGEEWTQRRTQRGPPSHRGPPPRRAPVPNPSPLPPWAKAASYSSFGAGEGLDRELRDFVEYMELEEAEHAVRKRLHDRISAIVGRLKKRNSSWDSARVEVFGSWAVGLCLPSSDVDFTVCDAPDATPETCELLSKELERDGLSTNAVSSAKVPIVRFSDHETGLHGDISFNIPSAVASAVNVRKLLTQFPKARPLIIVLKSFLRLRHFNNPYTGGLSSYSLYLMVFSFLQLKYQGAGLPLRDHLPENDDPAGGEEEHRSASDADEEESSATAGSRGGADDGDESCGTARADATPRSASCSNAGSGSRSAHTAGGSGGEEIPAPSDENPASSGAEDAADEQPPPEPPTPAPPVADAADAPRAAASAAAGGGGGGAYDGVGDALTQFLNYYGSEGQFDYETRCISVRDGGGYLPKKQGDGSRPHLLSLEDPCDPTNDVGRGTFRIIDVRTHFTVAKCLIDDQYLKWREIWESGDRSAQHGVPPGPPPATQLISMLGGDPRLISPPLEQRQWMAAQLPAPRKGADGARAEAGAAAAAAAAPAQMGMPPWPLFPLSPLAMRGGWPVPAPGGFPLPHPHAAGMYGGPAVGIPLGFPAMGPLGFAHPFLAPHEDGTTQTSPVRADAPPDAADTRSARPARTKHRPAVTSMWRAKGKAARDDSPPDHASDGSPTYSSADILPATPGASPRGSPATVEA